MTSGKQPPIDVRGPVPGDLGPRVRPAVWGLLGVLGASLLGSGCFWLEPIEAYDGAADGGHDLACDPADRPPPGLEVEGFSSPFVRMRQNTRGPSAPSLSMHLREPVDAPVAVVVESDDAYVVAPDVPWFCIPAGETSVELSFVALRLGKVGLRASVAGTRPVRSELEVVAADAPPRLLALSPSQAIVSPEARFEMEATLDFPYMEAHPVQVSDPLFELGSPEWEAGSTRVRLPVTWQGSETEVIRVLEAASGGGTQLADIRIQRPGPVFSELHLTPDGFLELHNPTNVPVSLTGHEIRLVRLQGVGSIEEALNGGGGVTLHTFGDVSLPPYGYYLVAFIGGSQTEADWSVPYTSQLQGADAIALLHGGVLQSWVGFGTFGVARPTGSASLERRAWEQASPGMMGVGGIYAASGNGWNSRASTDFVSRVTPDPQSSSSPPESFFSAAAAAGATLPGAAPSSDGVSP